MFIRLGERASGKTTELIRDAHFTGLPIVVFNQQRKEQVLKMAKEMRMDVTVHTVGNLKEMGASKPDRVMVDDLEDVLVGALGAVVVKATLKRGEF